jgi:hypothetical protein
VAAEPALFVCLSCDVSCWVQVFVLVPGACIALDCRSYMQPDANCANHQHLRATLGAHGYHRAVRSCVCCLCA